MDIKFGVWVRLFIFRVVEICKDCFYVCMVVFIIGDNKNWGKYNS